MNRLRLSTLFPLLCSGMLCLSANGLAQGVQRKATPQAKPAAPAPTESPVAKAPTANGMTVEDVISMIKEGLSEDLVMAALRKEGKAFELSPAHMIQLKRAGLSDNVVKTMLDPKSELKPTIAPGAISGLTIPGIVPPKASGATPGADVSESAIAANMNNPDAPHDSGIYLYTEVTGEKRMVALERAGYQGAKTGGVFGYAMTGGIKKLKSKAIIPGPKASIRTGESRPIFYFYFEEKSTGLGKSSGFGGQTVSNPNQFALVQLEVKKGNRETIIGEIGAFGASSGTNSKAMMPFKADRIRAGVYRVVPSAGL